MRQQTPQGPKKRKKKRKEKKEFLEDIWSHKGKLRAERGEKWFNPREDKAKRKLFRQIRIRGGRKGKTVRIVRLCQRCILSHPTWERC